MEKYQTDSKRNQVNNYYITNYFDKMYKRDFMINHTIQESSVKFLTESIINTTAFMFPNITSSIVYNSIFVLNRFYCNSKCFYTYILYIISFIDFEIPIPWNLSFSIFKVTDFMTVSLMHNL